MRAYFAFILGICSISMGCAKEPELTQVEQNLRVNGHWIMEQDGKVMLNPQTSGLVKWRGGLLTLSDRSAHPSQRLRLRTISEVDALDETEL